jgi:hypothetical protein
MEPKRKRPAVVAPFPPAEPANPVIVVYPRDNWWTLQSLLQTEDPWDLIYFNFRTYDPDEVNWYLFEKAGCRGTTPDGRNYRFDSGSGTRSITIYRPPNWDYRAPGPKQKEAQAATLAILRGAVAVNMSFSVVSTSLNTGDLPAVANAIETGKITLIHRPTLGHMALYDSQRNRMAIPFGGMPAVGSQALIVHEAVHAAMDLRKVRLNSIESEIMAYVAQALFLRRHGQDIGNSLVTPSFQVNPANFISWTAIFKSLSSIAERLDSGRSISLQVLGLAISLKSTSTYATQGDPANDGI